jgi:chloramphenicol 3-O-phosphotransferase
MTKTWWTLKEPIPRSEELLDRVQTALTPNRRPLLFVIDGADGIGKSSLASWLAWQTGMPTVHLDLFLTCVQPIQWLTADFKRAVDRRLDLKRPVVVEGLLVLDALGQIEREADFVAFLTGDHGSRLADQLAEYKKRRDLPGAADLILDGYTDPGITTPWSRRGKRE